jgi:hypothetical protein
MLSWQGHFTPLSENCDTAKKTWLMVRAAEPTVERAISPAVRQALKKNAAVAGLHRCEELQDGGFEKMLFAQILERDLDPLVVHLLIVSTELIAAVGRPIEELGHFAERGVWLSFKFGCAANVDGAVEIEVVDVVKGLTNKQPWHWLVTDAKHLGSRSERSYVLIAPANFVIEAQAGNGDSVGVQLYAFGSR